MARQDANEAFQATSFLYGGNASYIEELYARYEESPQSVPSEWQSFFAALKDDADAVIKAARGPSWEKDNWPVIENGEWVSALDGDWGAVERHYEKRLKEQTGEAAAILSDDEVQQATRDSVRAIMMIRAYRMRGHLHADLDPLGLAGEKEDYNELSPENYGFTPADRDRRIFLDGVLGLEYATVNQMLDVLKRTYCSTIGVEFMHISNPAEKGHGSNTASRGPTRESNSPRTASVAILQKLIEAEGFEQFIDVKYKGTKRFRFRRRRSAYPGA